MARGGLPQPRDVGKAAGKREDRHMKQHQDYDSSISLGLRPREAAKALGIGERLLWSKTNAGDIPHLRVGRAIIYPVDLLRDWMAEQASKPAKSRKGA